jgi:hypothetical protein
MQLCVGGVLGRKQGDRIYGVDVQASSKCSACSIVDYINYGTIGPCGMEVEKGKRVGIVRNSELDVERTV